MSQTDFYKYIVQFEYHQLNAACPVYKKVTEVNCHV